MHSVLQIKLKIVCIFLNEIACVGVGRLLDPLLQISLFPLVNILTSTFPQKKIDTSIEFIFPAFCIKLLLLPNHSVSFISMFYHFPWLFVTKLYACLMFFSIQLCMTLSLLYLFFCCYKFVGFFPFFLLLMIILYNFLFDDLNLMIDNILK